VLGWTGGGTARSALERLARGEAGRCRVTRDGVLTMSVHLDEYGKTPAVVFTDGGAAGGFSALLFDDFNRANQTLTDGPPPIGPTPTFWDYGLGTGDWKIQDGKMRARSSNPENRCYWDIGATTYRMKIDVPILPTDGGVGVRGDGDGTEVYVHFGGAELKIYTYDGADYTLRATSSGGSPCADGMTVTVDVTPTAVSASTSTGLAVSWASTTYAANTQVSVRDNNSQVGVFDNLRVNDSFTASARYSDLEVLPGSTSLVNASIVTRDGLDDVRAADEESVAVYGHRATTVDVALADDGDAADLADFHANRRSVPTPVVARVDAVIAREPADTLDALAALDLGSLAQVERTTVDGRPLLFSATVESLDWDLRPGRQALSLSTAPSDTYGLYGSASWFVIGESLLGGTAVLAPY
jgi:hypothetical protein